MYDCPTCNTRHSEPPCRETVTISVELYRELFELAGDFPAGWEGEYIDPVTLEVIKP